MKVKAILARLGGAFSRQPVEPPKLPDVSLLGHAPLAKALDRQRRSAAVRAAREGETREVMNESAGLFAFDRDLHTLANIFFPPQPPQRR